MKKIISYILIFLPLCASAQYKMSAEEYINTYRDIAIDEMIKSGIPASITLAQGIFESGYGGSRLATEGNNHFGIKCGGSWRGASLSHDDDAKGECFRKYDNAAESYRDHTIFLESGQRYAFLFDLAPTDYKGWAKGLKSAGYATNPKYADLIISVIDKYELYKYDTIEQEELHFASQNDVVIINENRKTGYINSVRVVISKEGDTWQNIAQHYDIKLSKLLKFNDLPCEIPLNEGTYIFLKSKKRKNKTVGLYTAQAKDTRYSISQQYGIKLKSIKRLNPVLKSREIVIGDLIRLQ